MRLRMYMYYKTTDVYYTGLNCGYSAWDQRPDVFQIIFWYIRVLSNTLWYYYYHVWFSETCGSAVYARSHSWVILGWEKKNDKNDFETMRDNACTYRLSLAGQLRRKGSMYITSDDRNVMIFVDLWRCWKYWNRAARRYNNFIMLCLRGLEAVVYRLRI